MEMIIAGPIGDTVSKTDSHWDEKGKPMISHIFVSHDSSYITSIQFGYCENGAIVMSAKHGPLRGTNFRVVKLNHNEYVTKLSAVTTWKVGINSLTFYTNLGKHGPICEPVNALSSYDKPFIQEIDLGTCDRREFGGFFGSFNACYLKSIGIYVNPIPSSVLKRKRF